MNICFASVDAMLRKQNDIEIGSNHKPVLMEQLEKLHYFVISLTLRPGDAYPEGIESK